MKTLKTFNRTSLFKKEPNEKTPFYKVECSHSKQSFFSVSMQNGFSKNSAKSDAMLILRMLTNQNIKVGNVTEFLCQVNREINIKNGRFESEIMARDALINKFVEQN